LRAGYADEDIFNTDECALSFKLLQSKTLCFKNEKCIGGKLSKERLTILVAANMTGSEKRQLLVIGKSAKLHCFKNVRHLPVMYTNNKKAWMTSPLFERTLIVWDNELRQKKRKILLLVDNCPAHPDVKLKNINLVFLPPNTTSKLQPMDQGVVHTLKAHYWKCLVSRIIEDIDRNIESKVSVLDAILLLDKAWQAVWSSTISNCFSHAGFRSDNIVLPSSEHKETDLEVPQVTEEYITVDDHVATAETLTDDIIEAVTNPDSEEDEMEPSY